jgi:hypothetical protein
MSSRTEAVLLAGVTLLVLGVVAAVWALRPREPRLDAALCPLGQPLQRHVVILVDPSDRLTLSQKAEMRREIEAQQASLAKRDRLTLLLLEPSGQGTVLRELFSRCFPGDGSDANPLYENVAMLKARFQEDFVEPLATAMKQLDVAPVAASSPLLQAIRWIATRSDFSPAVARRTLVFFTDGFEHSEAANFYRRVPGFEELRGSIYTELAGLDGATVRLRWLCIARRCDAAVLGFWRTLFENAGARSLEIASL